MNFVGIGPQELIVILVVALIFVGPQRLPKLAADLARMLREVRQYTGGIAAEFNEAIKEFEKDTEPERAQWKEIGEGLGDVSKQADEVARGIEDDAKGVRPADPAPNVLADPSQNGAGHNGSTPKPAPATEDRP
jgi:sec-independent protein translocase protein TatB